MTYLYVVFLILTTGLLAAGVLEQRRHLAQLHHIEHRVLVNGIRGKSSITRLCAGALRGGGLVTTAKTTGTAARFIHPDGSEEPVYRKWGIANVVEQIGIVRRAAAYRSDALVIECMAVMPDLQEINQSKLIRSTIGVLCNVREDHLAEMGPTLDDVARSLSRSMPVGGVCVTAERDRLHILEEEAAERDCELIAVDPESVTDEEMAGFGWVTFKENVAIALAVADLLGVNRRLALAGMWAAPPDPGVLSVQTRAVGGKRVKLANVFAANDPESTLMNVERLLEQGSIARPLHVVINCRPDRVERNRQMGALIARIDPDRVVLIGDPTRSARATIDEAWQDRVTDLGGARGPEDLLDAILADVDGTASLVAIGNIHGQGEVLLAALEGLEEVAPDERPAAREQPPARPPRIAPPVRDRHEAHRGMRGNLFEPPPPRHHQAHRPRRPHPHGAHPSTAQPPDPRLPDPRPHGTPPHGTPPHGTPPAPRPRKHS
ncbi:poly-gamma-glutamate synthase PgsB [Saccharothrix deserti]|uniref:poly-gamma-glutamate synthase PgsB n=1 Tax=Saccharothrix deserti TaxID=2593674 RepID=UPI001EE4A089|nr:poly-gamma-glutamate synthase PgsB [Saccharothrix deserti]